MKKPTPSKARVAFLLPAEVNADLRALAYARRTTHSALVAESITAFIAALPKCDRATLQTLRSAHRPL